MTGKRDIVRVAGMIGTAALLAAAGCKPSQANIQLRKEIQELEATIERLERQRDADIARIRYLEGPVTRPALPQATLDELYTAHGLKFGRLTGGYKADDKAPRDTGVVVHVVPTDQQGQTLKAAGRFEVSVFDLAVSQEPLVAQKVFSLEEAKRNWYGQALLFNYVLKVPFDREPGHRDLTVRVAFTDALTGREITAERQVSVDIGE